MEGFRVQSTAVGEAWGQEHEAAAHVSSAVRKVGAGLPHTCSLTPAPVLFLQTLTSLGSVPAFQESRNSLILPQTPCLREFRPQHFNYTQSPHSLLFTQPHCFHRPASGFASETASGHREEEKNPRWNFSKAAQWLPILHQRLRFQCLRFQSLSLPVLASSGHHTQSLGNPERMKHYPEILGT